MQIFQIITNNISFIFNCLIIAETAFAIMIVFILFAFMKNKKANFFLAFFIIIHSTSFIPLYFGNNNLIALGYLLAFITVPANSLIGVFLYYYTLFMTGRSEKLNKKDIIHFLSFIILIIINIFRYDFYIYQHPGVPTPIAGIILAYAIVNSIIYSILSFIKVKKYSRDIKNYTSDVESIDMTWLNKIIYFSILSIFIFIIAYSTSVSKRYSLYFASIDIAVFIIMLFIAAFYIINQPDLSKENPDMYSILDDLNTKQNNTPAKRYETIHIDKQTQESYLKLLVEYMEKNKPYLNERITIKDISEGLSWPYHHLSFIINNLLNKNFCDYINEYRIREVLNILNESKNEAVNLLTIAFKCGFNSKSTFNRVFKKRMGTTPSTYKKRCELSVSSEKRSECKTLSY